MSRWNALVIPKSKRTGEHRLCIDFRQLIDWPIKEVCQPPTVEECLNSLVGASWFTQLGLVKV
jgi:hypothetical protein